MTFVNKTRSCACKLIKVLTSLPRESEIFFFYTISEKMGRSGDGKRNILLGWPNNNECGFFAQEFSDLTVLESETDYIHSKASSLHNF